VLEEQAHDGRQRRIARDDRRAIAAERAAQIRL
jgi:hypothetical protein